MIKRLCIIPCGRSKIWDKQANIGHVEAQIAYTSTFHTYCKRYASEFFEEWVILSAKHGFLYPSDIISENYDVSFDSKPSEVIPYEELVQQIINKDLNQYNTITVLGGKKYYRVAEKIFDNKKLTYPLKEHKGIGYMVQALKKAVEEGQEFSSKPV